MPTALVTVLLTCFVSGADWTPPKDWTIVSISNRSWSAEVHLSRLVPSGETITVPSNCETQEPKGSTFMLPGWNGRALTYPPTVMPN